MVRRAEKPDAAVIAALAVLLWEDNGAAELTEEFSALLADREAAVFLGCDGDTPVGFAQCQLRHDYVEGTRTSLVGYLEGIFVKEEFRRRGLAGELLTACEEWAREKGCTEFASDCELANVDSARFHRAAGFSEANRIICFVKRL